MSILQSSKRLWRKDGFSIDSAVACPASTALPLLDLQFEELPGVTGFGDSSNFARAVVSAPNSLPAPGYRGGIDATGTPIGTPSSDFSARFDGVDDYLEIDTPFSSIEPFSIALWVKTADTDGLLATKGSGQGLYLRGGKPTLVVANTVGQKFQIQASMR